MVDMINFFCVVKFIASAPAASRRGRRKAEQTLVCEVANFPFFNELLRVKSR